MALTQRVKLAAHDAARDLRTDVDTDVTTEVHDVVTDVKHPGPVVHKAARHLVAHMVAVVGIFAGNAVLADVSVQSIERLGIPVKVIAPKEEQS